MYFRFVACSFPIRSALVVAQQMRHVNSVIQLGPQNFLRHPQGYTEVRAAPLPPPRRTVTPAYSSVVHAAFQSANTTNSTLQTTPQEKDTTKNTNSKSENNNVQPLNNAKFRGKKTTTDKSLSTGRSTTSQIPSPTEHPVAELEPITATAQTQSELSADVDHNLPTIAFRPQDLLMTLVAGKQKHDNIRQC